MGLAVEPPIRLDLACRDDDDRVVPVVWLRADGTTPIIVLSAKIVLTFDLPNDDTWARDPDTDEPIEPTRQTHTIVSNTPGDPAGWIDDTNFEVGQILAYLTHTLWSDITPPYTGTYSLTAVSGDSVQRCLARGAFTMETSS